MLKVKDKYYAPKTKLPTQTQNGPLLYFSYANVRRINALFTRENFYCIYKQIICIIYPLGVLVLT
jgi:hypothetical protein